MGLAKPLARSSEGADRDQRDLIRRARPPPEELLSLWPPALRLRLVLFVRVDEAGRVDISARLREHDFDPGGADLARRVRRVRGDVPVVFDRAGARPVVVPWALLRRHGPGSSRGP